jgi:predicted DNA-binding protein (UPF0251 family)
MLIMTAEVIMPRPPCCRRISAKPVAAVFKPAGIPTHKLDEVVMTLDEFEAIRLADLDGLYHERAAERMNVSRPTFGRVVEAARHKVAEAIILGKALKIEGGSVYAEQTRTFRCPACEREWEGPLDTQANCPRCPAEIGEPQPGAPAHCGGRRRRWMGCKNI